MNHRQFVTAFLLVFGAGLAVVQLRQAVGWSGDPLVLAFRTLPFLWCAIAISYAGYWLRTTPVYDDYMLRIAGWAAGSGIGFVAVVSLLYVGTPIEQSALLHALADALSAGILAGLLIGLYDAAHKRTRSNIESFAQKLEGLNQYGKTLNESTTVDEISALSIEVGDILLDAESTAFLVSTSAGEAVVDTTFSAEMTDRLPKIVATETATADVQLLSNIEGVPTDLSLYIVPLQTQERLGTIVLQTTPQPTDSLETTVNKEQTYLFQLLGAHATTALTHLKSREEPLLSE